MPECCFASFCVALSLEGISPVRVFLFGFAGIPIPSASWILSYIEENLESLLIRFLSRGCDLVIRPSLVRPFTVKSTQEIQNNNKHLCVFRQNTASFRGTEQPSEQPSVKPIGVSGLWEVSS